MSRAGFFSGGTFALDHGTLAARAYCHNVIPSRCIRNLELGGGRVLSNLSGLFQDFPKENPMRLSNGLRAGLIALTALFGVSASTAAMADSGKIHIRIVKAGFVIGGSGGSGTLTFHGKRYPLSIGGISYGFTFGASETNFYGTVSNIRRPSDVAGVYGQAGIGAAAVRGAQGVVLTNQNGAVLTLSGRQKGLIVSADLSGLALSLK
jgi:hypothetical protein